ncbi:MAG: Nonribosomal peptide synthetase [Bacteroidetes bacterium]|nr:Nonribosomal peptide synthetase [Bacteroidota bacterium]
MRELLRKLKHNNIDISLHGTDLEISYDGELLPENLYNEIRENKTAIVEFLKNVSHSEATKNIPNIRQSENYVLSSSQYRLWVLSQMEGGSVAYNIPWTSLLEGDLNVTALGAAFKSLIERHEILRTVFRMDDLGEVKQLILPADKCGFKIEMLDFRSLPEQELKIGKKIQEESEKVFDLEQGPLIRVCILQKTDRSYVLNSVFHHIICDGWSISVLIKELLVLYNSFVQNLPDPLQPLKIQYKDYAAWEQEQLRDDSLNVHRLYWLRQFEGEIPTLDLPADNFRPSIKTYNGALIEAHVNAIDAQKFKKITKDKGATLFMGLTAALNTLLYRYTGQNDLIIGSPIAGRVHEDLEDQVGLYVNTLALRTKLSGSDTYFTLLDHTKKITLEAYEHQIYPFDRLVNELQVNSDLSRNALFDVMLVLQNAGQETSAKEQNSLTDINVIDYKGAQGVVSLFDLRFDFSESDEELYFIVEYNTDIYEKATVQRLCTHLKHIISELAGNPEQPISKLDFIRQDEKNDLLNGLNPLPHFTKINTTVVDLFEQQVKTNAEKTALLFRDKSLTFSELHERSNQLANFLINKINLKKESRVGIMYKRGPGMIVSIMAVLKAGGAYVPMDPGYPNERLSYIINDSDVSTVLCEYKVLDILNGIRSNNVSFENVVCTDSDNFTDDPKKKSVTFYGESEIKKMASVNPDHKTSISDLMYVIYTSGSSGKPKGCMLEYKGVVNRLLWMAEYYQLHPDVVFLQKTSFTFDVSVWEIFMPLCFGCQLVICDEDDIGSPERIAGLVNKHKINWMHFVPGMLSVFISEFLDQSDSNVSLLNSLEKVFTSGEALPVKTVQRWYDKTPVELHNLYGPTEASIEVTNYKTSRTDHKIPIGRPIANTKIYILDSNDQLLPRGCWGEIGIAGIGVARGYLNQPQLTSEKFIEDRIGGMGKIYKTGDIGRWLPDGNIEFAGRRDSQVKIRGFRIELGEIESALLMFPSIEKAIVSKVSHLGDDILVAYLQCNRDVPKSELNSFLREKLPEYMLPAEYVFLKAFPKTQSGKTDVQTLIKSNTINFSSHRLFEAPANQTENELAEIWKEILGLDKISATDSFFELGGHSLKATRLASLIYKRMEVKLELKDIFLNRTLREQASLILVTKKIEYSKIPPAVKQNSYPLSSSQNRLWVITHMEGTGSAYNLHAMHELEGEINENAIAEAFNSVIERHEILRTVFKENDEGEVKQWVLSLKDQGFSLIVNDLTGIDTSDEAANKLIHEDADAPFNLRAGPLIRARLIRKNKTKSILSYTMHHIVSDGWSMSNLFKELKTLYNCYSNNLPDPFAPLTIQYKDYAVWQQQKLHDPQMEIHRNYWKQQFPINNTPVLQLPEDKPRPLIKTYNGEVVDLVIDQHRVNSLRSLASKENSTLFMVLLSSVVSLLNYYCTGEEDIVIGTPVAGRKHADLDEQIGFYINTLLLRIKVNRAEGFLNLLRETKKTTLDAYTHQDFPLDRLLSELNINRDPSRNPLFDVMITLHNYDDAVSPGNYSNENDIEIKGYNANGKVTSKFDLNFNFSESNNLIHLSLIYNCDIYERETIERMSTYFLKLIDEVTTEPLTPLLEINYLAEEEKQKIVSGFNQTKKVFPENKTLIDLFEEQVNQNPYRTALVFENREFTYSQLNTIVNRFAAFIKTNYGIKPDDRIGIKLEAGEWMVISVLAVLKSGGAYVPVDTEYPEERINFIMSDSQCRLIIDDSLIDKFKSNSSAYPSGNPVKDYNSGNLAYVIYTSGTTGNPKGVMIEHRNIVNYTSWFLNKFSIKPDDRTLLLSNIVFDGVKTSLFGALLGGATLHVIGKSMLYDSHSFASYIAKNKISFIKITPPLLNLLISEDTDFNLVTGSGFLRLLIIGGEKINYKDILRIHEHNKKIKIVNHYGPTETTVGVTTHVFDIIDNVPIGKPISNTQIFILGPEGSVLPVGIAGEICVSGEGIARGYINRPELSVEKFVPNPYLPGKLMYKTGDIGRWRSDGSILLHGRKDDQIKIRGYRIEPGEVECALMQYPGIKKTVVSDIAGDDGAKQLAAYFVSDADIAADDLYHFLKGKIPVYMVPSYYNRLNELPVTINGKLDKKRLPRPVIKSKNMFVPPASEMEMLVLNVWKKVLPLESISTDDDFFVSGGNSLMAMKFITLLNREGKFNIGLREIFNYPTIKQLANYMSVNQPGKNIIQLNKNNPQALSLFFIPPITGSSTIYKSVATHLEPVMNCYGLQYPGFDNNINFSASIEEMSEHMLREIVSESKQNRVVYLFGYSMGAMVAFEIARKLEKENYTVNLILADKSPAASIADLSAVDEAVQHELKEWGDMLTPERREKLKSFLKNNMTIQANYKLQGRIRSDILALEAKDNKLKTDMSNWKKFTDGNFRLEFLSGGHYDVLQDRNLAVISSLITSVNKNN